MPAMIIDFHTHSHASDGALSPRQLVQAAIAARVSEFAITDHDTVAGYREALALSPDFPADFRLISGTELSCVWAKTTIHVVGLDMDIEHPVLREGLVQLAHARDERAGIIAHKLEKAGMPGALDGAREHAGARQLGRPDFARWMVEQGHVSDANQAFDKYLGSGKMGDVKACWPELATVTGWIVAAGGSAILAHPMKYRYTRMKLRRLIRDFVDAGGSGIEIFSGRQQPEHIQILCKLADEFALVASAGSDFHREYEYGPRLGVDTARLPTEARLWRPGSVVKGEV